jgi:hypothetical protein
MPFRARYVVQFDLPCDLTDLLATASLCIDDRFAFPSNEGSEDVRVNTVYIPIVLARAGEFVL